MNHLKTQAYKPISSKEAHKSPSEKEDVNLLELATLPGKLATRGLALDEAILATAMMGSMGVFTAVAVPWDEVFPSANLQILSQLEEIEQANTKFFATHNRWPYEMTNGAPHNNVAALVTQDALRFPFSNVSNYRVLLKDVPFDVARDGIRLRHSYGEGGTITQQKAKSSNYNMEVVLLDVPQSVVEQLDEEIDGKITPTRGRIQSRIVGNRVDLVYLANEKS